MAAHLSWRWIALIMHGDHLKASVSYEEHAHLELLVQRRSKARHLKTADCPLERKDKPWQCLLSLSLSHTSFLFLSIALALSLSLSLTLSHSLSPPLSHQKRWNAPQGQIAQNNPSEPEKKAGIRLPWYFTSTSQERGERERQRGREKGRERGRERGKRLGQRKRDRWENGRPGLYLLGVWVPRCRLWDGRESARCCC